MPPSSTSSADLLATDGLFAQFWPAFSPRSGQLQMAGLVEAAIAAKESVVIEAASGSGKTIAYLTPVIAKGQKAIISTASRYLQQQLYRQDIPRIQQILGSDIRIACLQGRNHYLCPYYLEKNLQADTALGQKQHQALSHLAQRFRQTGNGELDSLAPELPVALRRYVTSSRDDCLGKECAQYSRCPLMKARQKAQDADIVVVNHSVLFTDAVMRREQLGDLLPEADVVVIDEAHRVADFAQNIVGRRLSSRQLKQFLSDTASALRLYAPEQRQLLAFIQQIEHGLENLSNHLPSMDPYIREQHCQIIDQLAAALQRLHKNLRPFKQRHQDLADMLVKSRLMHTSLQAITEAEGLCCLQGSKHSFMLQSIPRDLAPAVKSLFAEASGSWIFTSATLSVAGSPQRFLQSLGLERCAFHQLESAINYQQQAVLFMPELTVLPDHPDYSVQLLEQLIPLLAAVKGRVLCLFTSYQSLNAVGQGLLKAKIDCPLFMQQSNVDMPSGGADNYRLIKRFKEAPTGVLLGTGSFWEGLDLSGIPLAAVVIDKLPFVPPTDALLQLRSAELEHHGINSFEQTTLPDAVIRLRQGCGRLLRRISDRGVIMLADPRLRSKAYGEVFINSLPAMAQVSTLESLQPFLNPHDITTGETE